MNDNEVLIHHWMDIISAVFHAEQRISDEWTPKLEKMNEQSAEQRKKTALDYLRAMAIEIVESGDEKNGEGTPRELLLEKGERLIRELFGVDVRSRNRSRDVSDLRAMFCHKMREEGFTLNAIGDYLGLKHPTVHHNVAKISDALQVPQAYAELIDKYKRFNEAFGE